MSEYDLVFDWNTYQKENFFPAVELCDETLRDGIQSPSIHDPSIEKKIELLKLMDRLGITIADIGLPGAGPRAYNDVLALAKFAAQNRLSIKLNCAARTLKKDIEPIVRIQQEAGIEIAAYCFLGTSPVRQLVENWNLDTLKKTSEEALSFAIGENLKTAFVTEDTTRSHPLTLKPLFQHAIDLGVERLVLCDTVGHATPFGINALVSFTKDLISQSKKAVKIDWHGHNDRGLGLSNALAAAEAGCHRIHGTALGIGERVGNTAMDQLIVNLKLLNAYPHDVRSLVDYVETAAAACKITIPYNYPVCGLDAFRTATGVHAAAVIKALKLNKNSLADTIYSGVPAHWFGKSQLIEIGPMSGASNVKYWLISNKMEANEELVLALLDYAKQQNHTLSNDEIKKFLFNKA
ncbi:MAG: 2-isopropylmalate synthase [Myxococcales bacterium]|nr:2-isopropylmalate synthase [Myxococcales bacterium]USN50566.1 MAG: 2-isopropylmalate synthase [Myxococcales bacterium]